MEKIIFSAKIRQFRDALGLRQTEFALKLGIPRTSLINYEKGTSIPSIDFLVLLKEKFNLNVNWFLTGNGQMFLGLPEVNNKPDKKHPFLVELERVVEKYIESIENRLLMLEICLKNAEISSSEDTNSGLYISEPEPEYNADTIRLPHVNDITAGPPIQQSEIIEYIEVPRRFIKTNPNDYYTAHIRGESMTAAGIPNNSTILIRRSDVPRDGAIQVVRQGGRSTLKRVREDENHVWTLHYDDNTGRFIEIEPGEEYQIQGDFIAVLSV
jgi:SOS-response transcriptional repressor LexA